jgi:hypothetical protein
MLDLKEANRLFYSVKGSLIPDDYTPEDITEMYNSYFKRLWGNHEASTRDEKFEELWANRHTEIEEWPDFVEGNYFD